MTREDAIKVLNMVEAHGLADEAKQMAIKALSDQRTGHWQDLTGLFFCSECDGGFAKPWRYCPNCGAKMESEEQE